MHNMHAQHACAHGIASKRRKKYVGISYKQLSHQFRFKLHLAAMAFIQQIYMYMYISLTRTVVFAI